MTDLAAFFTPKLVLQKASDPTKSSTFDTSALTGNRTITVPDADFTLGSSTKPNMWLPEDHALISWAYDPVLGPTNSLVLAVGTVYVIRVPIRSATTITNVHINLNTAGTSLANCFAGIAQGGTLLATSADQSTPWSASGGEKVVALTSPQAVTAAPVDILILANTSTGTATPQLARTSSNPLNNRGLTGSNARYATADTGRTTLPATVGTKTLSGFALWGAVS